MPFADVARCAELLRLAATSKSWWKIGRSDALWRRLYLARWKLPKPPGPSADCPRYHLNFYELYRRRVLITLMKGPREVVDLADCLRPPTEAGKAVPSMAAAVHVCFQDNVSIVTVDIEGCATIFDTRYTTPQMQVSGRVVKEHQEKNPIGRQAQGAGAAEK